MKNSYTYLKSLYLYLDTMRSILNTLIKEDLFSLEDMEFEIKKLTNGKSRDIEGYQAEIFKIGRFILIPKIHKLLNLAIKHDSPSLGLKN